MSLFPERVRLWLIIYYIADYSFLKGIMDSYSLKSEHLIPLTWKLTFSITLREKHVGV